MNRNNDLDVLRGIAIPLVLGSHAPIYPVWSAIGFAAWTSYLNDMAVTQNSARFSYDRNSIGQFLQILDPLLKNHSTVGDGCVAGGGTCTTGRGVLGEIQTIQAAQ